MLAGQGLTGAGDHRQKTGRTGTWAFSEAEIKGILGDKKDSGLIQPKFQVYLCLNGLSWS